MCMCTMRINRKKDKVTVAKADTEDFGGGTLLCHICAIFL